MMENVNHAESSWRTALAHIIAGDYNKASNEFNRLYIWVNAGGELPPSLSMWKREEARKLVKKLEEVLYYCLNW